MRKVIAGLSLVGLSFAGEGYQVQDLTKFLKGTDGQEKAVRYISQSKYYYRLEKTDTGRYNIVQNGSKVAERQDISLNGLGELRKVKITNQWAFGNQNYGKEFAILHLTREQKRAFRENPTAYITQLNSQLAQYGYRAEYKMINQKNPKTGQVQQVPKLILQKN